MQTWIALFRGINVGGRNILPMAKLKALFEALNCKDVRTCIQSGNVVFASRVRSKTSLTRRLLDAVEREFAFRPKLILLTVGEFSDAKDNNPFPDAISAPKTLHFLFLDSAPKSPDIDAIAKLATKTEAYKLMGSVFYFHAPDGLGDSKLAAKAERNLGVIATGRNYATIEKISAILAEM